MRIEQDIKLDFKDVLIRPKRSTLSSRKDVDLNRTFIFKNSGQMWTGVPIIFTDGLSFVDNKTSKMVSIYVVLATIGAQMAFVAIDFGMQREKLFRTESGAPSCWV